MFTLHIYQYLSNGSGGRSRLHLIDFGGCERTKVSRVGRPTQVSRLKSERLTPFTIESSDLSHLTL